MLYIINRVVVFTAVLVSLFYYGDYLKRGMPANPEPQLFSPVKPLENKELSKLPDIQDLPEPEGYELTKSKDGRLKYTMKKDNFKELYRWKDYRGVWQYSREKPSWPHEKVSTN